MTATVSRSRLARSDLRVVSAAGTTAAFVAELTTERATQARRRHRWLRGLRSVFRRRRHGGLRTGVALTVLCGVALSVYLLNADSVVRTADDGPGGTSVAAADCPDVDVPGPWNLDPGGLPVIGDDLDDFCDVVGEFTSNLVDSIVGPIGDGFWAAFHQNRFCGWRVALDPEDPNQGINSLMTRGVGFVFGVDEPQPGTVTTWNQYGIAGTSWNTYFLDCLDSGNLVNYAANFIFGFAKVLALVAILLFQQTFNNQIVDYFFVPQDGAPESAIDTIMERLNTEIYVEFFAVAVVIGALVLLYNNVLRGQGSSTARRIYQPDAPGADAQGFIDIQGGHVRNSGLSDALGKIGIMVVVAGFAALFVNYGSGFVRDANAYTNEVGALVLSALAGNDCKNSDGAAVSTTPYDCAAQTMYDTLVFRPWASGNIGELEVLNNEAETENRRELAMRMLRQNAYSMAESTEIANPGTSVERRQQLLDDKQDDRTAMVEGWGARFIAKDSQPAGEFDPTSWRPHSHVETDREAYWQQWSGGEAGQRIIVAGLALMASFTLGLVMIAIAVAYLVLQLMTVLLAMVAPMVFLIGLIPGGGYRLLLRWAEIFMGLFIKRVALVCFIGILLAMLHIIFALALAWWMQVVLVIGVAMVGLSYRHQFTNWASSGMAGMGATAEIATGGVAGAMQARRSIKQARQGWRSSQGLGVNERFRVAGSTGYAALDRPYETEAEYLPAAQGGAAPSRTQQQPLQAPREAASSRYRTDVPVQAPYGPRGRTFNGTGTPYRQGSTPGTGATYPASGQGSPYAPPGSPASGRRSAGYVYQPEGGSGAGDDPRSGDYGRERVKT